MCLWLYVLEACGMERGVPNAPNALYVCTRESFPRAKTSPTVEPLPSAREQMPRALLGEKICPAVGDSDETVVKSIIASSTGMTGAGFLRFVGDD